MRLEPGASRYSPAVQPNPDPKPGRWILPVVIVAMMGFAWLFINAAEDPTISPSDTTTSAGGSTTTTTLPTVTSTTLAALPDDVVAYRLAITQAGTAMTALQQRVVQANNDWDTRTVGFPETLSSLQGLDTEIKAWRAGIDAIEIPTSFSEYEGFHAIMAAAATEVSRTSGTIVPGLRAPDTGELRAAAVAAFNEAVSQYGTQVDTIAAYVPGGNS